MSEMRHNMIRMAACDLSLRPVLLNLIKVGKEFPNQKALQKYLLDHPAADKSKHEVKQKTKAPSAPADDKGGKGKGKDNAPAIDPEVFHEALPDYKLDVVGHDVAQAKAIAAKIKDGIDKSADVCKMSPSVCKGNMGLSRDKMPQIPGDMSVPEMLDSDDPKTKAKGEAAVKAGADPKDKRTILTQMLDTFKSEGVKIKKTDIPVGKLKATQSEIKASKTFEMADAHLKGKFPNIDEQIVVSSDGHILDGHHRWAALLTISPDRPMHCIQVGMTMAEMLKRADALPGVYREDFQGKPTELPDDIQKAKKDYLEGKGKKKDDKPAKGKKDDEKKAASLRIATAVLRREAASPYLNDTFGFLDPADAEALFATIGPRSKVSIVNRFGQVRKGVAVMRSPPHGWVLNMGGPHGTPDIVTSFNVVQVDGKKSVPLLRQAGISSKSLEVLTNESIPGYRIWYPDPSGQTYTVTLVGTNNPITVRMLARQALADWKQANPGSIDSSALEEYVTEAVTKASKGRVKYIRWSTKSYPD